MATRTRCTPRSVETGEEAEEDDGSFLERPSSSSKPDKSDGVCLVCALGTKGSHTYRQECKRYVAGATLKQMQKAARGGRKGHSHLLLELALQRKDEEQKREREQTRSKPSRRKLVQTSSSSSTSSSPRRRTEKRKREKAKLQREEEKLAAKATMTEKKREDDNKLVTTEQDESPDMVDEILGRKTSRRQAKKEVQNKEESCNIKPSQSGNTKQKGKQATTEREARRVPPPPSARVDESKIDEEAVARLERTRLERLQEDNPGPLKQTEERSGATQLKEEEENKSQPLTPLMPREESRVGDGSTTEVEDDTKDQKEDASAGQQSRPTQPPESCRSSQTWHRNNRKAGK